MINFSIDPRRKKKIFRTNGKAFSKREEEEIPGIGRDSRCPRRKCGRVREREGGKKVARWWSRGGDVYRGRSVMTIRVHTRVVRVGSDCRCVSAKEDNWLAAAVVLAGGLLTSHPVLWLVAISFGPRHIKVRRRFARPQCLDAENCHRRSSGTWFSSGGSPPTFAPTYFSLPRVQYILKLLMEKLDGWLISVDEDETGDGDGWYKNSRFVIVCDQREEMWFRYRRWILKTVNW